MAAWSHQTRGLFSKIVATTTVGSVFSRQFRVALLRLTIPAAFSPATPLPLLRSVRAICPHPLHRTGECGISQGAAAVLPCCCLRSSGDGGIEPLLAGLVSVALFLCSRNARCLDEKARRPRLPVACSTEPFKSLCEPCHRAIGQTQDGSRGRTREELERDDQPARSLGFEIGEHACGSFPDGVCDATARWTGQTPLPLPP